MPIAPKNNLIERINQKEFNGKRFIYSIYKMKTCTIN